VGVTQPVGQQVLHHLNQAILIPQQDRHLLRGGSVQGEASSCWRLFSAACSASAIPLNDRASFALPERSPKNGSMI
jgi:hypothetical protein